MNLVPLLALGLGFWGHTPACGQPTIVDQALPIITKDARVFDKDYKILGQADVTNCRITVDIDGMSIHGNTRWAGEQCMVVVHEYGHLLGHNHTSVHGNIMNPVITKPFWPCKW